MRNAKRNRICKRLMDEEGVSVPVNESSSNFFGEDMLPHLEEFLSKDVLKDSLAAYIMRESIRNHQLAKEKGRKAIRHCPLFIRLGLIVRQRIGYAGGMYDLLAASFDLRLDRTLCEYRIPGTNDPDGIIILMLSGLTLPSTSTFLRYSKFYGCLRIGKLKLVR